MKVYPKTEEILRLLAGGAVLTALILSPHLTIAAISTLRLIIGWDRYKPYQLKRTIDRLRKRHLVKIVERNNETVIELTDLGKKEILHYDINKMMIKTPRKWDGRWWMVIFDIPDYQKKARDMFRKKLLDLGFYFIQESVCLYPYVCQKEIEFIRETYGIKRFVNLLKVEYFEGEYLAKEKFGL